VAERILLDDMRPDAVRRAGEVLRKGEVALLPAEGLYGYHVLASHPEGIARLERLKPRDPGKGWIGLVARPTDAYRWIAAVPAPAAILIQQHWPGALTLVLEAGPGVPPALIGPGKSIALRCPGSAFLRDVILAANGLLVSTSANAPGAAPALATPPPDAVPGEVSLVVDSGPLSGEPSTVVRVSGERVTVLREGAVRIGRTALDAPPPGP
jgi:tRNA threonylcarbamoyl adenosine modification protein (Sua5/YciO/YrdC/YwlC family)